MDEELKAIVQRMIDAGESEANIGSVIQTWNAQKKTSNQSEVFGQGSGNGLATSGPQSPASPTFEDSNAAYAAAADDRMLELGAQENFPVNLGLGQPATGGFGSSITQPSTFGDIAANATPQETQPSERQSRLRDWVDSVERGSVSVGSMLAGLPEFLYEQTGLGNYEQDTASLGPLSALGALSKVKDFYDTRDKELSNRITRYEDGIVDSALKGNFSDAGSQLLNAIGESIAPMLLMATTGGAGSAGAAGSAVRYAGSSLPQSAGRAVAQNALTSAPRVAATALPFASGKWQEIKDDPSVPDEIKPLVAYGAGLSEVLYEGSFGTAKLIRRIADGAISKQGVNRFVKGFMDKALESTGVPASAFKGAVSEVSTELTNNIIDKYSGVDPDRDLFQGLKDAAVVGSVMDTAIATPSSVSRSIANRSERKKATELSQANNEILTDLSNPDVNLTPEQRQVLMDRYNQNTDAIDSYITQAEQQRANLTPRQREIQQQLINRAAALDEVMNNDALSEMTRQEAEAEQQAVQDRLDRQVEVDTAIAEFQRNNPEIEVDYLEDLPDTVVNTFSRVEEGVPVDPVAIDEASQWMYGKYQELTALKEDPNRRLTIEQIEGIQNQLGEDIATLENYKLEQYEQAEGETVRPTPEVADGTVTQEAVPEPAEAIETTEQVETPVADESAVTAPETTTEAPVVEGELDIVGQPAENASEAVEVSDTEAPQRAANAYQSSFERLTEGMTPEQIDADPDLVRLRDRVQQLSQETPSDVTPTESTPEQVTAEPTVGPSAETATEQTKETVPERITYPKNDQEEQKWDKQVSTLLESAPADVVDKFDYISGRVDENTLDDMSGHETDLYMQAEQELADISPNREEDDKLTNLPDIINRIKEIRSKQTQEGGTQDAIQERKTKTLSLGESPIGSESVEQEVREQDTSQEERQGPQEGQVDEVTETAQPETPAEPVAEKPKKAPTIGEILTSPEARQSRAQELRDRINKYRSERPSGGLGISKDAKARAEYWRDITDYAAIRIVDGAISSVNALARELGIPVTRDLNNAYNKAKSIVAQSDEAQMTTARNADTARKRAQLGFEERVPIVTLQNPTVEAEARQLLEDGYDVGAVIEKAMRGDTITALETSILAQYVAAQEAKVMNVGNEIELARTISSKNFKELVDARNAGLDSLMQAYTALELSGTAIAQAMQIRKSLVYRDLSLANMMADMRMAKGNVTLTDAEIENIQKKYQQMSDLSAEIRNRNEELEAENARLNALLQTEKIKAEIEKAKRRATTNKSKPTRKEAVDAADKRLKEVLIPEFKEAFREAFAVERFAAIPEASREAKARFRKAAYNLIKGYIERIMAAGGRVYVEDVVDYLHGEVVQIKPDVTREQIMNLIDSTNDDTRATRTELEREVRLFRTEIRLMNEIARLEAGGNLRDKIRQSMNPNVIRLDELRKRLKLLRDNARRMNDPSNETKPIEEKQDDYDFDKQKERLEKRIKEYREKISNRDFAPERKQLVLDDPRLKGLRKELADQQHRYRVEVRKAELNRRSWVQRYIMDTLVEIVAIPRTLMATGDMSALFRQMMFTVASRPILTAKAALSMFKFWGSQKSYDNYFKDYRASEAFELAQKSGLALTEISDNINAQAREEMFMSNLVNKIEPYVPIFGGGGKIGNFTVPGLNLHKRAERSFTGSINKMRIDLFQRGVEKLMDQGMFPDTHKQQYEQLATYVNAATGRGPVPQKWSGIMSNLSAVFFAPRLMSSRLYLIAGGPIYHNTNEVVRKMYIRDLMSFISFGMSVAGAAIAMGADVDDDPTSVDFGMVRIGDTRYDIWGGFSQYVRFLARMAPKAIGGGRVTSSTGRSRELNSDEYMAMTRMELAIKFGRSKLSPTASLVWSSLEGKNYMGEPFSWAKELNNMWRPLIIQDVQKAWTKHNEGPWALARTGLPAFFGISVNTWRANEFLAQGVDNKLIELTNEKKVATMMPEETKVKLYDLEDGEERKPTTEEFKRYLSLWSEHIKKDLTGNYDKYKKMTPDKFADEFDNIKSRAASYAKEQISGVSSYDKSFTSGGKTYQLTPDQLRRRVELNDQYVKDNDWRVYIEADKLEAKGMNRDLALIEARKSLKSKARAYSKKEIEREFEGQLVEKE